MSELELKVAELQEELVKTKNEKEMLESDLDFQIKENEKLERDVSKYQSAIREWYYYVNRISKTWVTRPQYKKYVNLVWDIQWEDNQ